MRQASRSIRVGDRAPADVRVGLGCARGRTGRARACPFRRSRAASSVRSASCSAHRHRPTSSRPSASIGPSGRRCGAAVRPVSGVRPVHRSGAGPTAVAGDVVHRRRVPPVRTARRHARAGAEGARRPARVHIDPTSTPAPNVNRTARTERRSELSVQRAIDSSASTLHQSRRPEPVSMMMWAGIWPS